MLSCPYSFQMARLVVHEMADSLALELVDQHLVTDQLVLTIGYDIENLKDPQRRRQYHGQVSADRYGRAIPKHTTGTVHLDYTSSAPQNCRGGRSSCLTRWRMQSSRCAVST